MSLLIIHCGFISRDQKAQRRLLNGSLKLAVFVFASLGITLVPLTHPLYILLVGVGFLATTSPIL